MTSIISKVLQNKEIYLTKFPSSIIAHDRVVQFPDTSTTAGAAYLTNIYYISQNIYFTDFKIYMI